jgi:Fur family ferric uptake transcriptional regulator
VENSTFQRNTPQRAVIIDELCHEANHPTATELYERVRLRLPRISLGTVYRNLEILARSGVIGKLEHSGSETRFDGTPHPHYHVRCNGCGRVDDLHEVGTELVADRFETAGGYLVVGHRLEFVGVCPSCRREQSSTP